MKRANIWTVAALLITTFVNAGCSEGQRPFRIVQICLASQQEVAEFVIAMNAIAQSHRMVFTDRSGATEAELRAIDSKMTVARPQINISADYAGSFSFGAGNLGLPTRQMAIGFNGSDLPAARKFADAAVAQLSARWQVYEVPAGRGALPLPNCG